MAKCLTNINLSICVVVISQNNLAYTAYLESKSIEYEELGGNILFVEFGWRSDLS